MNYLKLLLLLFVTPVYAQNGLLFISDTLRPGEKHIDLPENKNRFEVGNIGYMITTDSAYKSLFPDSTHKRLPVIDFEKYELLSRNYCMQCETTCEGNKPCHRNACMYSPRWFLLEKSNRTAVHPETLPPCELSLGYEEMRVFYNDSTFRQAGRCRKVDFKKKMVLSFRTYADCDAVFSHDFFLDSVRQCLVWRLYEESGRCSKGYYHQFTFETDKLPENYPVVFEKYPMLKKQR